MVLLEKSKTKNMETLKLFLIGFLMAIPLGTGSFFIIRNAMIYGFYTAFFAAMGCVVADFIWITIIAHYEITLFFEEYQKIIYFGAVIFLGIIGMFILIYNFDQKVRERVNFFKIFFLSFFNLTIIFSFTFLVLEIIGPSFFQQAFFEKLKNIAIISSAETVTWASILFFVVSVRVGKKFPIKVISQYYGIFLIISAIFIFLVRIVLS